MLARNPDFSACAEQAPDGDAELQPEAIERFQVAPCPACEGPLKPKVTFFGENVARPVVEHAWRLWERADVLLVLGSSLTVFSGYRFVKKARARGLEVVIATLGPTRGDASAALKVDAPVAEIVPPLVELV